MSSKATSRSKPRRAKLLGTAPRCGWKHEWKGFETETKKYLESSGRNVEQQQAVFQGQVTAQLNAWHETADKLNVAAKEFAIERRREIDATRLADEGRCCCRREKNCKSSPGREQNPGPTLNAALAETRATFDRANQAAREAFKRAPVRPNSRTATVDEGLGTLSDLDRCVHI